MELLGVGSLEQRPTAKPRFCAARRPRLLAVHAEGTDPGQTGRMQRPDWVGRSFPGAGGS